MDPRTAKGFAILPTRGRVATHLPQFLAAAKATGMTIAGAIVVNDAEYASFHAEYDALDIPGNWTVLTVSGDTAASKTEQALKVLLTNDMDYVFWLADDLRPETMGWDVRVIEQLEPWRFVSTNDGLHAPQKANGCLAWGADLLRTIGYIFPPGIVHNYADDMIEQIGRATGCWTVDMSVMVRHEHASKTGKKDATSAKTNAAWAEDDRAYAEWGKTDKGPAIERVLALMQEHGVDMFTPDLSGIEVMLATPSGDGTYESVFVNAIRLTEMYVKQYGGQFRFAEMLHCSDIAVARARIVGSFRGSTATHLFLADSDQGWRPEDFIRTLMSGRDFIAAAGVRKVSPASFAVNVTDDFGRPVPLQVDSERGYIRASGVGLAFACLSRKCVERMVEAYPDLAFDAAEGREEHALFNPIVVNRRYLGEDYAWCHRWRAIGGDIWVDPTINLDHVGKATWSGAWIDQLAELVSGQDRAA